MKRAARTFVRTALTLSVDGLYGFLTRGSWENVATALAAGRGVSYESDIPFTSSDSYGGIFEDATDIVFYVGRAINPAHQNPNLPINFSIKMRLVDQLSECLDKMGKRIKVSYF